MTTVGIFAPSSSAKFIENNPLRYSYLIDGKESHQYLCDDVYNYPYLKCKLKDVEKIHDFSFNHKYVNPGLRCDGSVIQILDENVQAKLINDIKEIVTSINNINNVINVISSQLDNIENEEIKNIKVPYDYNAAIVTFVVDDCKSSFLDIAKVAFDNKGVKCTLGVVPSWINTNEYMTMEEIKQLKNEGYEFVSHSYTHSSSIWNTLNGTNDLSNVSVGDKIIIPYINE